MDMTEEIGLRIRKYRKELKLTQEELSKRCGLHSTYIGQIERGEKNPSIESIFKICKALSLNITTLFEKIGEFGDGGEEDRIPAQIYNLAEALPKEQQIQMLNIMKQIVSFSKK